MHAIMSRNAPAGSKKVSVGQAAAAIVTPRGKTTSSSRSPVNAARNEKVSSPPVSAMFGEITRKIDALSNNLTAKLDAVMADNDKLRETVKVLEDRLSRLEKAPAVTPVVANPPPAYAPTRNRADLASVVAEEVDISSRRLNVVVRGIVEDEGTVGLKSLCSEVLAVPESTIAYAERLGKHSTDAAGGTGDASEPKARPVKIRFTDPSAKSHVYKKRFGLKMRGDPLFVDHDLTKQQRETRKAKVATYKQLRTKGVKCCLPYTDILNEKGVPLTDQEIAAALNPST